MAIRNAPPLKLGAAVALSFLAGAVDAIGFLQLGGLFVSFMSGNSTRLGVFAAQRDVGHVAQIGAIIASFVLGAALGSALSRVAGRWQQPAVLLAEAAMLVVAAVISGFGFLNVGACLMAGAMGVENATFADRKDQSRINLTFMTGTLVRLGETLATALFGGGTGEWWRHLVLWLGLTLGAVVGGIGYGYLGVEGLYVVSAAMVLIAIGFAVIETKDLRNDAA